MKLTREKLEEKAQQLAQQLEELDKQAIATNGALQMVKLLLDELDAASTDDSEDTPKSLSNGQTAEISKENVK